MVKENSRHKLRRLHQEDATLRSGDHWQW